MQKFLSKLNIELLMALMLTFIGGFIEIYSLRVHSIFAGMQTGNLITMFTDFIDGNMAQGLYRLLVIGVFLLGCFLAEFLRFLLRKGKLPKESVILGFEIVFLLPLLFLPVGNIHGDAEWIDIVADIFLALFASFQYTTFRKVNGESYATTMMTNLMSNIAKDVFGLVHEKDEDDAIRLLEHILVLLFFVLGVISFYFTYIHIGTDSELAIRLMILIPLIILIFVFVLSFFHHAKEQNQRINK